MTINDNKSNNNNGNAPPSAFTSVLGAPNTSPHSHGADYVNIANPAPSTAGTGTAGSDPGTSFSDMVTSTAQKYQAWLDRINGKFGERWVFLGGAIFVYLVRTLVYPRGWYIITYGLGIYLLNLFIAFLSPKFDPEFEFDEQDNYNSNISGRRSSESDSGSRSQQLPGGSLDDGEIRPFYRRLPEFQFWWAVTKGVVIALALTFTRATDIPVYWPILLIYFLFLFTFSMRKQISHMIRYRYVPWTLGKKRYAEASTTTTAAIGQFVNTTINNWVISTQPTGIPQHATVNPHIQQKKQQD